METFASTDSSAVSNNFSFYRVLNSVFAFLYIHGISDFSMDFHQWLFHYQSSCPECSILNSLHFVERDGRYYSRQVEEALSLLESLGLIRRDYSPYALLFIHLSYSIPIARQILSLIPDGVIHDEVSLLSRSLLRDLHKDSIHG